MPRSSAVQASRVSAQSSAWRPASGGSSRPCRVTPPACRGGRSGGGGGVCGRDEDSAVAAAGAAARLAGRRLGLRGARLGLRARAWRGPRGLRGRSAARGRDRSLARPRLWRRTRRRRRGGRSRCSPPDAAADARRPRGALATRRRARARAGIAVGQLRDQLGPRQHPVALDAGRRRPACAARTRCLVSSSVLVIEAAGYSTGARGGVDALQRRRLAARPRPPA